MLCFLFHQRLQALRIRRPEEEKRDKTLRIFELPSSIELQSKLVVLRMNQNDLIELPDEICRLTALTELEVADNLIEQLPLSLAFMTNLEKLVTYGNESHVPPREIMPLGLTKIQQYLALLLGAADHLPRKTPKHPGGIQIGDKREGQRQRHAVLPEAKAMSAPGNPIDPIA